MPCSRIRRVGLENIEDVVHILNSSSRSRTFEYRLDALRFLAMARMWNLSYDHSWIGYCGAEAAGVVLNAVDAPSREAYSLYWGVLPEFRGQGVLRELLATYLGQFRREGYRRVHGDAHADSPWPLFEKLGWRRRFTCFQMEAARLPAAPMEPGFEVRRVEAEEAAWRQPDEPEARCWTGGPAFPRNAGRSVEILGAFQNNELWAHCVLTQWTGHTMLFDLAHRPAAQAGARRLIAHLAAHYPAPYSAYMAPEGGAFHAALTDAGFAARREIAAIALDLAP